MNERDFAYWLQGYAEICGKRPTEEQWKMIKDHLALVFNKVTPIYPDKFIPYYNEPAYCTKENPNPYRPSGEHPLMFTEYISC